MEQTKEQDIKDAIKMAEKEINEWFEFLLKAKEKLKLCQKSATSAKKQ